MNLHTKDKNYHRARNVYTLFAIGAACCFSGFSLLVLLGTVAVIFGIFMAYSGRRYGDERFIVSHNDWQIRTFWIGNLVIIPLAMIAHIILLYQFTDIESVYNAMLTENMSGFNIIEIQNQIIAFTRQNIWTLTLIKCATYGLALIWWLLRCFGGYRRLINRLPAAHTDTAS